MGRNPLHREALVVDLWKKQRARGVRAIGAVDVALWDLLGKAVGQPIHRLLGTYREAVPAYASSAVLAVARGLRRGGAEVQGARLGRLQDPSADALEGGHQGLRGGAQGGRRLHRSCSISTWSYDYPTAVRVGRAAEEMGFHWYEDPLADQDIYNYVKLKQQLSIPILATEYPITGLDAYQPWIMLQATDFLRGDVAVKGGITTLVKTRPSRRGRSA